VGNLTALIKEDGTGLANANKEIYLRVTGSAWRIFLMHSPIRYPMATAQAPIRSTFRPPHTNCVTPNESRKTRTQMPSFLNHQLEAVIVAP